MHLVICLKYFSLYLKYEVKFKDGVVFNYTFVMNIWNNVHIWMYLKKNYKKNATSNVTLQNIVHSRLHYQIWPSYIEKESYYIFLANYYSLTHTLFSSSSNKIENWNWF